jgi:transcriptional regulator with XRE-family HTH domain
MMTVGERIRTARKNKFTQAKLAEAIGVHEMTVRRWEIGPRVPNADDLKRLAAVLDTSLAYLLGEVDDPTPPLIGITKPHAADEGPDFIVEQQQKVNPRIPTLEDFARVREASRNLESLEDRDLRAAEEMIYAMLETVQRERAFRTAQDGALKSA